jgi:PAS domain S-box-containing protein
MTLAEFQARYPSLATLQLAALCGCSPRTLQQWRSGRSVMPKAIDRLLTLLDQAARGRESVLLGRLQGRPPPGTQAGRHPAAPAEPEAPENNAHARRVAMDHLLTRLSARLSRVSFGALDRELRTALGAVARMLQADRAVFASLDEGGVIEGETIWGRRGCRVNRASCAGVALQSWPWLDARLKRGHIVAVADIGELSQEAADLAREMQRLGVQARLLIPLRHADRLAGFIGFARRRPGRFWRHDDYAALTLFGNLLMSAQAHRRTALRLREDPAFTEMLLATSPDAVHVLDAAGVLLAVNETAARRFGLTVRQAVGRDLPGLLHPDKIQPYALALRRALKSGKPGRFEDALGGQRFMSAFYPVRAPDGTYTRLALVVQDITESRKAMEALSVGADHAHELERVMGRLGVVIRRRVDAAYGIEFASTGAEALWGYKPEELVSGQVSWVGITHPEDVPRLEAELAERQRRGEVEFPMEYRVRRKDGEYRWMADMTRLVFDHAHRLVATESLIRDDHERKTALLRLQDNDREWEQVFDAVGQPVMVMDPQQRILAVNRATLALLGQPPGQVVGAYCWEVMHEDRKAPEDCPARALLEAGPDPRPTRAVLKALGRTVQVICTPILDADKRVRKIVHVACPVISPPPAGVTS